MALAQLDFVDRAEVVHLLGPPGTGRAISPPPSASPPSRPAEASTATPWPNSSTPSQGPPRGPPRRQLRFYTRTALLIVDEIGYVSIDPDGANLFFQLVNARYEKGAMILTSNRGFAEWGDLFGDAVVATALLDRLLHHAVVIHIEGASYRLREHPT